MFYFDTYFKIVFIITILFHLKKEHSLVEGEHFEMYIFQTFKDLKNEKKYF